MSMHMGSMGKSSNPLQLHSILISLKAPHNQRIRSLSSFITNIPYSSRKNHLQPPNSPHMALNLKIPLYPQTPSSSSSSTTKNSINITCSTDSNGPLKLSGATPGLRVAYQGSAGAYSELAAKTACGSTCSPVPWRSFPAAIAALHADLADRAVLPVESTMDGSDLRNYHLLLQNNIHIVQELNLFVHYCLLAIPGVQKTHLRRVISHPLALAHCARALAQLGVDREPVDDTAGAVEMLRSQRMMDTAAIASPRTASIYGLDVIAHGIQDENWNVTRFLILSRNPEPVRPGMGPLKTSMVVAHRGGSMTVVLRVLSAFSRRKINLRKLEVKNPAMEGDRKGLVMVMDTGGRLRAFPHVLYVDFEGSVEEDENVKEAVEEIEGFAAFVRILGCYAADTTVYDLH